MRSNRDEDERDRAAQLGADVARTCVEMYRRQPAKLAPEAVSFASGVMSTPGNARYYLSRPETVETLMYLYRLTADEKYRQWGGEILDALIKYTKVDYGFA